MPSIAEAFSNVNVLNTMKDAWANTQRTSFEYGGWIKYRAANNTYTATMRTDNNPSAVMLSSAPLIALQTAGGWTIIGDYHCHPGDHPRSCRPSLDDIKNSKAKSWPMFVFTFPHEPHMTDVALGRTCKPLPSPFKIERETIGNYAVMWRIN